MRANHSNNEIYQDDQLPMVKSVHIHTDIHKREASIVG